MSNHPGANTASSLSPLLKEVYPKAEKAESKKKKKKTRFPKISKLLESK